MRRSDPPSPFDAPLPGGSPRFLFYSHDSWGLGHLRRSLTLAEEVVRVFPRASVLIVTGSPCASFFATPDRVDTLKLPSVTKDERGAYVPRRLGGSLDGTLSLRRQLLLAAFEGFRPDALVIDHQVTGLGGEALPMLIAARERGVRTVLGIRDVIDAPEVVAREWGTPQARWALAEGYDRVCVYGTPEVFDTRAEYPVPPELSRRLEFSGYVTRAAGPSSRRAVSRPEPHVLVTMGGGEDGAERIRLYLAALAVQRPAWSTTIVGGPMLDRAVARRLKREARLLGATFHRSYADLPRLFDEAHAVVGMAGYNTGTEILRHRRPAVYLPRVHPRREQAIRARRLERLGWARSLVDPSPGELRAAVEDALAATLPPAPPRLDGARQLAGVLEELLEEGARAPANGGAARPSLRRALP